jgi:fumarate reductase subunit D
VDPNWFFSSVAQSVAALVGILGGFVTSRIIGSEAEFARKRARTAHLIAEARLIIERFTRVNIARYDMHANQYAMASLQEALADHDDLDDVERWYQAGAHLFSPFTPTAKHRETVARELKRWRGKDAATVRHSHAKSETEEHFAKANRASLWEELTVERDDIRNVVDDARRHLSACRQHHRDVSAQPESSGAALTAVIVTLLLFFVGVVYPLTFLGVTAEQVDAKVTILIVTSLIVLLAVLAALYFIAIRLRYSKAERDELKKYCSAAIYSRHLEVFEANMGAL